jgi:phosphohistidine phosphatase
MKLYLVQHGEALSKDVDPERPLSDAGHNDIMRLAGFLRIRKIQADQVLHSGKARARQTAEILANSLTPDTPPTAIDGIAPNDSVSAFAEIARSWSEDTAVVGHLPFMARLVAYLVTGNENNAINNYRPGSIVCLEADEDDWHIGWMIRPELV